MQAYLIRPVSAIRSATVQRTDERVRMESEVVAGALAMKMLSWEKPFLEAIIGTRAAEAAQLMRMARIRAVNFALVFLAGPVMSLALFSVAAYFYGPLRVSSVFYVLSLLNLPRVSMTNWFVMGGWP